MKVTAQHRQYMRERMSAYLNGFGKPQVADYLTKIKADPRVTDWEKRYRWDLCHASGLTKWICTALYPYANDSHIDTALKAIMTELEGPC